MNWTAFILFTGGIGASASLSGLIAPTLDGKVSHWQIAVFALLIIYLGIGIRLL